MIMDGVRIEDGGLAQNHRLRYNEGGFVFNSSP